MTGVSLATSSEAGAAFVCLAAAADKQFTVPAYVTGALPPSEGVEGFSTGLLLVGWVTEPSRFHAPGLDAGFINHSATTGKNLPFN
jgi:hypothetical protein